MRRLVSGLISSLVFLAGLSVRAERPRLQLDGGFCERLIEKVDEFFENREEQLLADFKNGKSLFTELGSNDASATAQPIAATTLSAAQKAGLLTALLEDFLPQKKLPVQDLDFVTQIIREASLKNRVFTRAEVERGLKALITHFDLADQDPRPFLKRWLSAEREEDLREKIALDLLRDPELARQLAPLNVEPLFSRSAEINAALARNGLSVLRSVLTNAALMFLGFPIIDLPHLKLLFMAGLDPSIRNTAKIHGLTWAARMADSTLGVWETIHHRYRSVRKIYYASLLLLGLGYLSWHPEIIAAPVNSWITGYHLHHLSARELRAVEERSYSTQAVVEEQLQSWLEAQDEAPTTLQIEEKRRELEDQERAGVLRVFGEKKP